MLPLRWITKRLSVMAGLVYYWSPKICQISFQIQFSSVWIPFPSTEFSKENPNLYIVVSLSLHLHHSLVSISPRPSDELMSTGMFWDQLKPFNVTKTVVEYSVLILLHFQEHITWYAHAISHSFLHPPPKVNNKQEDSSLNFIRLHRVVITERVITTRSNRMKFRLGRQ